MGKIHFFLIPILFLAIGAIMATVVFFILWPLVSFPFDSKGLINELLWTFNYLASYFFLAFLVSRYFEKKAFPAWSLWLTVTVLFPITAWLILFAGITDSPQEEYLPRTLWVIAPALGYAIGIISDRKYFILLKNHD